jgi:hypothetical protein
MNAYAPNQDCEYIIRRTQEPPKLEAEFDEGVWKSVDVLRVAHFHPRGSDHKPDVRAKVLYDDEFLYVHFNIRDRYVICTRSEYQSSVCKDSCAEFFVQPKQDKGYFNFEINCCGGILLSYVEDPERTADGFKKYTMVPWEQARSIRLFHSLSGRVFPEISDPVEWKIAYAIPFALLNNYVGPCVPGKGDRWRANFYKCADDSSHPHWGAWAPIGEELSFHQPTFFGTIQFA